MENYTETKKTGMFGQALNYAILTSVVLILISLVIYIADLFEHNWISFLSYAVLLAGIIAGTLKYRNESLGGFISYGKALGFGVLTAFLVSVITGLFSYVFYQFIAPDALERLKEIAEMNILEVDPNASDQQLDLARRMINPILMFFTTVFSYTFIGFIFSLVTAAFLKKKEPVEI